MSILRLTMILILIIAPYLGLAKLSNTQNDLKVDELGNHKRSSKSNSCVCGFVSFKCCKKRSLPVKVSWKSVVEFPKVITTSDQHCYKKKKF